MGPAIGVERRHPAPSARTRGRLARSPRSILGAADPSAAHQFRVGRPGFQVVVGGRKPPAASADCGGISTEPIRSSIIMDVRRGAYPAWARGRASQYQLKLPKTTPTSKSPLPGAAPQHLEWGLAFWEWALEPPKPQTGKPVACGTDSYEDREKGSPRKWRRPGRRNESALRSARADCAA